MKQDWTNEQHHASDYIGASMLRTFRQSPRLYWELYVGKTRPKPEPSEAMTFGSLVHTFILEPEKRSDLYAVAPKCDRRTTIGKATWSDFCAMSTDKTVVTAEQWEQATILADAVHRHPLASRLLEACETREQSFTREHESTGLMLKCRPDALGDGLMLDIKTTSSKSGGQSASPRLFASTIANFEYHAQAAFYRSVVPYGDDVRFVFVAVSKEPPHECALYEIDDDAMAAGRELCESSLSRIAALKDAPASEWWADYERGVNVLSLPRWASFSDEWTLSNGD